MWLNEDIFVPTPITIILWLLGSLLLLATNLLIRLAFRLPFVGELGFKGHLVLACMTFGICTTLGLALSMPLALVVSRYFNTDGMMAMYICFFLPGVLIQLFWAFQEKFERHKDE